MAVTHRRDDQREKDEEEKGRLLPCFHRQGNATKPKDPFPPIHFLPLKRTWERFVVVKGPSLSQPDQMEMALEAKAPVRLVHGLNLEKE